METGKRTNYWGFYWPLALTGLVTIFANQLQNATLARYPNAAYELATFAIAAGIYHLFDAVLVFMPQLVNLLVHSRLSARRCMRFTLTICLIMTLPVILMALPPIGRPVLGRLFHLEGAQLQAVMLYMALLSPNVIILGLRHYYTGLIVQARRTGLVTILNLAYLAVVWVMLVAGRYGG